MTAVFWIVYLNKLFICYSVPDMLWHESVKGVYNDLSYSELLAKSILAMGID